VCGSVVNSRLNPTAAGTRPVLNLERFPAKWEPVRRRKRVKRKESSASKATRSFPRRAIFQPPRLRERCSAPVCVFLHRRSRSLGASRSAPSKPRVREKRPPLTRRIDKVTTAEIAAIFSDCDLTATALPEFGRGYQVEWRLGDRGANDHRLRELGSRLCGWATWPPVPVPC
jgi:hypothetical protein